MRRRRSCLTVVLLRRFLGIVSRDVAADVVAAVKQKPAVILCLVHAVGSAVVGVVVRGVEPNLCVGCHARCCAEPDRLKSNLACARFLVGVVGVKSQLLFIFSILSLIRVE